MDAERICKQCGNQKPFNPDMLRIAMDVRGYSIADVLRIAPIKRPRIARWLGGLAEPDQQELGHLCYALHFPESFFYDRGEYIPAVRHCTR